ncbi:MAG: hypothetical protein ABID79_06380 [Elusimicrobiota bacterium]
MLKRDKIWIFILLAIVIFQYSEIIFHKKIFYIRDLIYIFHPWKTAVTESLMNGRMPLWNPYSYCGMPLLANFQTAVFYPFSIFFYIFGFIVGLKLYIIGHTFLAALFLFLYLRSKKIKTIASIAGGVIFSFGGYFITKIEFLSLFGTGIWLPLIILLFSGNIFICALAIAISLFAGYLPTIFFIMIFLFVEALVENKLKKLVLVIFTTIIISAIQILPGVELILNSVRKSGLKIEDASIWAMHFFDWLSIMSPIFLGKEADSFVGEKYFWLRSFWIGFGASIVAVASFFFKRKIIVHKKTILYLFLIFFSLFFSVGRLTPLYGLAYNYIPGFNLMRYPSQILYIPFFIFIILTVEGLTKLKKITAVLSILIISELTFYIYKIHPTIEHSFYFERGLIANFLTKNKTYFRFFSTPKTTAIRTIKVPDYGNIGIYIIRDRLSGIISVPYHLFDANGIGEPLEINEQDELIYEIKRKKDVDDASGLLSLLNIKYILSDYTLNSKNWQLVHKSHLFIYENKKFQDRSYVIDENGKKYNAEIISYLPEKIKIEAQNSGTLILSDTFYRGWNAYINGQKTNIEKANRIFRSLKLQNAKNYIVFFLYNPILFTIGLLISLLSICIIIFVEKSRQ